MIIIKILASVFLLLVCGLIAADSGGGNRVAHVPPAQFKPPDPPKKQS